MRFRAFLIGWSVFLLGCLTWALWAPGALIFRDMAVLDHPALSQSAVGFGDLPARSVPQDGALALLGTVFPAGWIARLLLVGSGAFGAYGAVRAARFLRAGKLGTVAAVTLTLANPFVMERLLQGHWSLVIAAFLLPGVTAWGLTCRPKLQWAALFLCSLTPTGCVAGLVCALLACRNRVPTALFGMALSLPWLVPSLLLPPASAEAGASAFAARAESPLGLWASLAGLGGIWNAQAVPVHRSSLEVACGVVLLAVLLCAYRGVPQRLLGCAAAGLGACLLLSTQPELAGWLVREVPGAALFRDAHKLVLFAIPALVFLAARLRPPPLALAAVLLTLAQVWNAPADLAALRPSHLPAEVDRLAHVAGGRDVFMPGAHTVVPWRGDSAVNPLSKALSLVEDGSLTVDGQLIDAPSPRHQHATACWNARDLDCLQRLGIGVVVEHGSIQETGVGPQRGWRYQLGLALTWWWLALLPAGYLLQELGKLRSRRVPREFGGASAGSSAELVP